MNTKRDLDLRLAVTDAPLGDMPEKITCPAHDDPSASMAVYRDHTYCYGCGKVDHGYYALALLLYGNSSEKNRQRAREVGHRYTAREVDAYRERVDQQVNLDPLPWGLALSYHNLLYSEYRRARRGWLLDRGLTDGSILRFQLGHDGVHYTIPIYGQNGNLLTIRYRRDDYYGTHTFDPRKGKEVVIPKYSGIRGRNGLFLFGAREVARLIPNGLSTLTIVEGELDAVRLWQEGVPAVSATNGAGSVAKLPALIRATFPQIDTLEFACDADEAGQEANRAGISSAQELGFTVSAWGWPEEWGKDITEVLVAHSLEETGWMQPSKPA